MREKSGEGGGSWVLRNECEQRGATEALSWGVGVREGWGGLSLPVGECSRDRISACESMQP